jgi:acetolactate synthase-1/2/3 large subunit
MWAAQYLRWHSPRTLVTSGGAGTMGFGVPSAIGAKVASPQSIVVDIDGDASFSMTCMELLTAREYNIGVKILILNNHFQGMVKQWQDLFYEERYSGTPMNNPDFAKMAQGMGITGLRLDHPKDLSRIMKEFLECKGPVVLDAQVTKESHVFPMVPAGRALDDMVYGPPKVI